MKTLVTSQQIGHFAQFGWIEFENFLSPDEWAAIQAAVSDTIAHRLNIDVKKISRFSQQRLYRHTRDCWRDAPLLKHFFCSKRFTATAGSLINYRSLFLACDQWIPPQTILEPLNLAHHLSFQNLVCGCLLILEGSQAGNVRFFQPDRLPLITAESQMILAYGHINSVYIYNPADLCNCDLKNYGYSFGDRLREDTHPFCQGTTP